MPSRRSAKVARKSFLRRVRWANLGSVTLVGLAAVLGVLTSQPTPPPRLPPAVGATGKTTSGQPPARRQARTRRHGRRKGRGGVAAGRPERGPAPAAAIHPSRSAGTPGGAIVPPSPPGARVPDPAGENEFAPG